jgi:SHS2 domain-containing protein
MVQTILFSTPFPVSFEKEIDSQNNHLKHNCEESMRSHKLEPHVADVRLVIKGDTLQELFTAAVEGMAELIKPGSSKSPGNEQVQISLEAPDTTVLLIDFLAETLTHTHVNKTVYPAVTFSELTPTTLNATIQGSKVDAFDEDVKAVTFHEAEVKQNELGLYETTIIFDI